MKTSSRHWMKWAIVALFVLVLAAYVGLTPAGLLSKADLVGYAVCHRIPSHSFFFAGRQLPLCARCSGTFLGALTGLFGQIVILRRRRESEFPFWPILLLFGTFIALMGGDGLNSYLSMIPGAPTLYEPQQWLRLVTGALNGLALSGILLPMVHFSLWRKPSPDRTVQGGRDLVVLLALEAGMVGLVLSGWPPLLYPLALASAAGVLAMLSLVNTAVVLMITGWENRYSRWTEALPPFLLGLTLALLEVGAIDVLRYAFTGTLAGLPGLGQ